MQNSQSLIIKTVTAKGAIRRTRFVNWMTGAQAVAGDLPLAVSEHDARDGEPCAVSLAGLLTVTAGAAIALGQRVKTDAQGCAVPAADNEPAAGRAFSAATGAGYPVSALLFPAV